MIADLFIALFTLGIIYLVGWFILTVSMNALSNVYWWADMLNPTLIMRRWQVDVSRFYGGHSYHFWFKASAIKFAEAFFTDTRVCVSLIDNKDRSRKRLHTWSGTPVVNEDGFLIGWED